MYFRGIPGTATLRSSLGTTATGEVALANAASGNGIRITFVSGTGDFVVVNVGTSDVSDPATGGTGGTIIMKGSSVIISTSPADTHYSLVASAGSDNKVHIERVQYYGPA